MPNQATIPVDDLAVLRGYAAWDIIRTFNGTPYFLEDHLDRLRNSAEHIGLELPLTCDEIKSVVLDVLAKNPGTDEANIRVLVLMFEVWRSMRHASGAHDGTARRGAR